MKDFKKFVNTEESKTSKTAETVKAYGEKMNIPEDALKNADSIDSNLVKNLTEKYKDNQNLLVKDIMELAEKNKKEGTLDLNQLDDFEEKLTPMLNDKQKKMLSNIMGMIKKK